MNAEGKNGLTKKTSVFENGLIWFGAGVSIAEILTGTYLAPLGMAKGVAAILLGHLIGCCMMFAAGLIGARTGKSAMETVKMSFGKKGGLLFSFLNVLQLVGWTGIMIYDGALAANGTVNLVIGALIILWIAIGVTNLGKLNTVAMAALFLLTIVLCVVIFGNGMGQTAAGEAMTFGAAVELSVAMPLSWLPVISDYTREAQKPVKAREGYGCQRDRLRPGELLDVHHRNGSRAFHRGDGYRRDHGEGRPGDRRPADHHFFHGDHHLSGCLFRRRVLGIHFPENEGKAGGDRGHGDRHPGGHPVSHG